jgi:hypothetical protein
MDESMPANNATVALVASATAAAYRAGHPLSLLYPAAVILLHAETVCWISARSVTEARVAPRLAAACLGFHRHRHDQHHVKRLVVTDALILVSNAMALLDACVRAFASFAALFILTRISVHDSHRHAGADPDSFQLSH